MMGLTLPHLSERAVAMTGFLSVGPSWTMTEGVYWRRHSRELTPHTTSALRWAQVGRYWSVSIEHIHSGPGEIWLLMW